MYNVRGKQRSKANYVYNANRKKRGKGQKYEIFYPFEVEDFKNWLESFKKTKSWQKNNDNRHGFEYYLHKFAKRNEPCEYSNDKCKARVLISKRANENGKYIVKATKDATYHLMLENANRILQESDNTNDSLQPVVRENETGDSNDFKELWEQFYTSFKQLNISTPEIPETTSQPQSQDQPVRIISISYHNANINWNDMKVHSDLEMIIVQISNGVTIDKKFYENFRAVIDARFVQLGVCHHFRGATDSPSPISQFSLVKKALDDVGFNKHKDLFAISVLTELNASSKPIIFTARLIEFINLLLRAGFMRPVIYCNNNSWKKLIDTQNVDDEIFSKLPLWIAHFTNNPVPRYPETWKERGIPWWMWHYTDTGSLDGIINHVNISKRNQSYSIKDKYFRSNV